MTREKLAQDCFVIKDTNCKIETEKDVRRMAGSLPSHLDPVAEVALSISINPQPKALASE